MADSNEIFDKVIFNFAPKSTTKIVTTTKTTSGQSETTKTTITTTTVSTIIGKTNQTKVDINLSLSTFLVIPIILVILLFILIKCSNNKVILNLFILNIL